MIRHSDTSVYLADGITELKIDEALDLKLTITTYSGQIVVINASFCVIESMCDIILGFNDTVLQAGDMLVEMIQRAVAFSRREARHALTVQPRTPPTAIQPAPPTAATPPSPPTVLPAPPAAGAKAVLQSAVRRPSFRPTTIPRCAPLRPAVRPSERRERGSSRDPARGPHRILSNAVAGGAQAVQALPMCASEPGQDLRRPWSIIDDRGPEEDETPFDGMFGDHVPSTPAAPHLAFMETSVEEALAEYHREIDKLWLPAPTAALPDAAAPPGLIPDDDAPAPAKPLPKRGRFAPEMHDLPGFKEFMRDEAVKVFVPSNWLGIKVEPIEFQFKENMPQEHKVKSRPISRQRLDMVKAEIDRLRKYHFVDSKSAIVSAMSDADKATEPFVRICGDYRWVNEYINIDQQHIPRVQHELERFAKFTHFIDLDMVNSFHQFLLGEKTSNRLSIITPWGTFRPVFMPEGVSPATGVLQAHMREIFADFSEWSVVIFDNFCIGGYSLQDVFDKFKLFIARCILFNIFLKFVKCYFGWRDVKFFGYLCDGKGYQIDDERKVAIRAIPFPTGLTPKIRTTRMQAFLGFSLYFKDFVDHYSILAAPLYDMTVKGFVWDESAWGTVDYRAIFYDFKEEMCNCFKLIWPDFDLPWILQPDASAVGVGAILFQVRTITDAVTGAVTTRREPLACVSHKFSGPATRWAVIKQEMYAIYHAVQKLSYYLRYKPFQVQTDHSNLVHMEKSSVAIITRWRIYLQGYPILSIVHLPGKANIAADFLSRVHECDYDALPEELKKQLACLSTAYLANLPADTGDDELEGFSTEQILQFLTAHESSPSCARGDERRNQCDDSYCQRCGDNFKTLCGLDAVVKTTSDALISAARGKADPDTFTANVPEWDEVVCAAHTGTAMHWGALPTWRRMQENFVHQIPYAYVVFFVLHCATCQKFRKTLSRDRIAPVTRHLKVSSARSTLGMDGFSLTPPDKHGHSHMHVIINHFTKHVFLYVCTDKTAITGADAIITYMAMFGRFDRILTDPGSDYTSKVVEQLNQYLGYLHAFSLVDRHESNGTEPTNREIARHVKALVFDLSLRDCWSEPRILALVTYEINSHRSSETNYSAFDLTFGSGHQEYFKSLGAESLEPIERYGHYIQDLDKRILKIRELSVEYQFRLARHRATDPTAPRNVWQPGDRVLLDNLDPANKLQAPRLGPFRVVKHVKNEVFLENLVTGIVKPFYAGRLSLYTGSKEDALKGARADTDQHLVERISGYRGDTDSRETMEFFVEFSDGDSLWKRFDRDLSGTAQLESYCKSLPQLAPLLSNATEVSKHKSLLSKTMTIDTHPEGTVIFTDLRARALFEPEWYLPLKLEEKDIRNRYVRLTVGKNVSVPGTKKGSRVELIDEAFSLAHRVGPYFLYVHGTVRDIDDLPQHSEIVDAAFAREHPYKPINSAAHRRLVRRDLAAIASHTGNDMVCTSSETFSVLSRNVNGVFGAIAKGLLGELRDMSGGPPDLLILQETKAHSNDEARLERILAPLGYVHLCMIPGTQSQHAGVAIACKTRFLLHGNAPTERGRALAISVHGCTFTDIYAPIICGNLDHMIQRRGDFDNAIVPWIRGFSGPQFVCGDFNSVSSTAIDLEVPVRMRHTFGGFQSSNERRLVNELQAMGFQDTFRHINPFERAFTCFPSGSWRGMRARVDFVMASKQAMERVLDCRILPKSPASDHAGVLVTVEKPTSPDTCLDFTELFNSPPQTYQDWIGEWLGFGRPTPPPPVTSKIMMMRYVPSRVLAIASAPPPPPPPPPPRLPVDGPLPEDDDDSTAPGLVEDDEDEAWPPLDDDELDEALALSMPPLLDYHVGAIGNRFTITPDLRWVNSFIDTGDATNAPSHTAFADTGADTPSHIGRLATIQTDTEQAFHQPRLGDPTRPIRRSRASDAATSELNRLRQRHLAPYAVSAYPPNNVVLADHIEIHTDGSLSGPGAHRLGAAEHALSQQPWTLRPDAAPEVVGDIFTTPDDYSDMPNLVGGTEEDYDHMLSDRARDDRRSAANAAQSAWDTNLRTSEQIHWNTLTNEQRARRQRAHDAHVANDVVLSEQAAKRESDRSTHRAAQNLQRVHDDRAAAEQAMAELALLRGQRQADRLLAITGAQAPRSEPDMQRWDAEQHHQLQLDHHAELDAAALHAATANAAPTLPSRVITHAYDDSTMPWTRTSADSRPSAARRIAEGEEIMWAYGPRLDMGFDDTGTICHTSSDEEEPSSDDDDSLGSRALSPDPLALHTPRGGRLRLLHATQRLAGLGFPRNRDGHDDDSNDACPEWAINSSNDSYESSVEDQSAQPEVQPPVTPAFEREAIAPASRTLQPINTPLIAREGARPARPRASARRHITPVNLPRAPGTERKEDDDNNEKTGPG